MDTGNTTSIIGFTSKHLNDDLFKKVLSKVNSKAVLLTWSRFDLNTSLSTAFVSGAIKQVNDRIIGFVAVNLEYVLPGSDELYNKDVVLKSKARAHEIVNIALKICPKFDGELYTLYKTHLEKYGIDKLDYRELQCIDLPGLQPVTPEIYWSWVDEDQDIFVFAMEYFDTKRFSHIDTVNDRNLWDVGSITKVLYGLAKFHAAYYDINPAIPDGLCKDTPYIDGKYILDSEPRWRILIKEAHKEVPEMWKESDYLTVWNVLNKIHVMSEIFEKSPKTLIYFDCSSKNLCLRKEKVAGKDTLCLYDWEFACFGPPQIDLALFLTNVLPENSGSDEWKYWVQVYLSQLKLELGSSVMENLADYLELGEFMKVFDMCMIERLINYHGTHLCLNHKHVQYGPHLEQAIHIGNTYLKSICNIYNFE